MKGLICAGGEATRLQELTRVTNKHLLPVGRWPMVYYPLQLLQLAGVHEVLVVTGKHHAGQMIDLLGDGRVAARGGDMKSLERIYAKHLKKPQAREELDELSALVKKSGPVCILCYERDHRECRRQWIAEIIEERDGVKIENLVAPQGGCCHSGAREARARNP